VSVFRLICSIVTTSPFRAHPHAESKPDSPTRTYAVKGFIRNHGALMLRISHFVASAAGAAILLVQPALAQAHAHRHHAALTYRHHFAFASPRYFAHGPHWRDDGFARFGADNSVYNERFAWQSSRADSFDGTAGRRSQLQGLVEQQASANGVPASLVHRVIMRESGYNPRAVSSGNYGLMQIRLGTARAMGYNGSAAGLLDAETNMNYAVRYLAGAYRASGGNEDRAVALYARGYNAPRVQEASQQTWAPAASGPSFAYADEAASQWSADARRGDFGYAASPARRRRHAS
jgi:soluble lytic murein transglycosylase-like protein